MGILKIAQALEPLGSGEGGVVRAHHMQVLITMCLCCDGKSSASAKAMAPRRPVQSNIELLHPHFISHHSRKPGIMCNHKKNKFANS